VLLTYGRVTRRYQGPSSQFDRQMAEPAAIVDGPYPSQGLQKPFAGLSASSILRHRKADM
jgi:hypothetical protein